MVKFKIGDKVDILDWKTVAGDDQPLISAIVIEEFSNEVETFDCKLEITYVTSTTGKPRTTHLTWDTKHLKLKNDKLKETLNNIRW